MKKKRILVFIAMFYVYVLASIQKEFNHKNMLVIYRSSKNKMSTEKFQVNASKNKVSKVQIHRSNFYMCKPISYSSSAFICSCTELKSLSSH